MPEKIDSVTDQLISAGRTLHDLHMVPATSGNFSARLGKDKIAITVSGVHKGKLTREDIMTMTLDGQVEEGKQPSAETALHLQLYKHAPGIQCVLHPHSPASTLTRKIQAERIELTGYELQKAFEGITTHTSTIIVPIFENSQDIPQLAEQTGEYLKANPETKAYIIRGHGFYTWASSVSAALRHCEALEFLLQCELKKL